MRTWFGKLFSKLIDGEIFRVLLIAYSRGPFEVLSFQIGQFTFLCKSINTIASGLRYR